MTYREPEDGEVRPSGLVYYPNPGGVSMRMVYSCRPCATTMKLRWYPSLFPNTCEGCGCVLQ